MGKSLLVAHCYRPIADRLCTEFSKTRRSCTGTKEFKGRRKAIIPKYKISDDYYRTILPFKESEARGLVVNNLNTRYDLIEFETGLMRVASNHFDPETYLFQEGQYLDKRNSHFMVES